MTIPPPPPPPFTELFFYVLRSIVSKLQSYRATMRRQFTFQFTFSPQVILVLM